MYMSTTSGFLLCYLKSPPPLQRKGWLGFPSSIESCRAPECHGVQSMLFHVPGLKLFGISRLLTSSTSPFHVLIGPFVRSGKLWGWVGCRDGIESFLNGKVFRGRRGG